MDKALVIIDMQNDFINGKLPVPHGKEIIPGIVKKILEFPGDIYLTKDVHSYYDPLSYERVRFPEHCIDETEGCEIVKEVKDAYSSIEDYPDKVHIIRKCNSFRSVLLESALGEYNDITIVGVCTDICVVTNALNLRAALPSADIHVLAYLCRGTTTERHYAALDVMRSCLIDVVEREA